MIEQQLKRHGEAFSPKLKDGVITMVKLADDVKVIVEQASNHLDNTNNPHEVTATTIGLGNVTNESKETMFTNPTFTGIPTVPTASSSTDTTQIASTAFVKNVLKENYGDVTLSNTLAVTKASGSPSFYHFTPSASQMLNTVETTFGNARFGESYGSYSAQVGATISLYVDLRVENGVIFWDEYYNTPQGTFIGTETVKATTAGADSQVSFNYETSDDIPGETMSLREGVLALAAQIQMLRNQIG